MKTIEKKIDTAEQRISKLKDLSRKISSFEEYAASRDYKDIAESPKRESKLFNAHGRDKKHPCSRV